MRITKEIKLQAIKPAFHSTGIYSTNDIERKHCGHWFSKDTKRFFGSRIPLDCFPSNGKVYFVSSEYTGFDKRVRAFTVRVYDIKTDDIGTVGEFNGYGTKSQALSAALNCAYDNLESNQR